jgi:hypothetical protein
MFASIALVSAIALPSAALAQETPDSAPEHTGTQIRVGLGGGRFQDDMEVSFFGDRQGKAEGASVAFQLSVGLAVSEGFFLGGGIFTDTVTDPKVTFEGSGTHSDVKAGTLVLAGFYANYFFGDNWHAFGAVGGANMRTKDEAGDVDEDSASGAGVVIGGGYDAWVADDWMLGGAARMTAAGLWGDFVSHEVTSFSLLLVGTYD